MTLQCANFSGSGSGPEWRDWGWIFSTQSDKKSTEPNYGYTKAFILLTKSPLRNEICGTVQLNKTTSHTGLVIELQGIFKPTEKGQDSVALLQKRRSSTSPPQQSLPISKIFHRFCGARRGVELTSPANKRYPFVLKLPEDEILPPTFSSSIGEVQYTLRVWKMDDGKYWSQLGEKSINYSGQLVIRPGIHLKSVVEQEVATEGGVRALIQLPRKEFLLSENIPFTLKIFDSSQNSVKKVTVYLWSMFSYVKKTRLEVEEIIVKGSKVVDCVTFKRFLKREVSSRDGKFAQGKINYPTYSGEELPKLKISYVIQMNVTTRTDSKVYSTQQDIIVGTEETRPGPTAPELLPNPSAPRLDDDSVAGPSTSTPGMGTMSLATSMLSLFGPPGYSALSSRATSTLSLEALPPHYDDV